MNPSTPATVQAMNRSCGRGRQRASWAPVLPRLLKLLRGHARAPEGAVAGAALPLPPASHIERLVQAAAQVVLACAICRCEIGAVQIFQHRHGCGRGQRAETKLATASPWRHGHAATRRGRRLSGAPRDAASTRGALLADARLRAAWGERPVKGGRRGAGRPYLRPPAWTAPALGPAAMQHRRPRRPVPALPPG